MSRTTGTSRRRLALAAAALLASPVAVLATTGPASAALVPHKDSKPGCHPSYGCIQSRVSIYNADAWAGATYTGPSAVATTTATIVLYQCSGTGSRCGVIAANRIAIETGTWEETSHKPWSFGHTYRACVSGAGVSNVCTPLMA